MCTTQIRWGRGGVARQECTIASRADACCGRGTFRHSRYKTVWTLRFDSTTGISSYGLSSFIYLWSSPMPQPFVGQSPGPR